MKSSLITLISFLTLALYSCDSLDKDVIPEGQEPIQLQGEVFSLPNTAVYFDLKKSLNLAENGTFRTKAQPKKGTLNFLEKGFVRYTPHHSFTSGSDFFVMEALSASGASLDSDTINIIMVGDTTELPCFNGALSDHVKTFQNTPVSINVIKNDGYCKDETSGAIIEIVTEPINGEVTLSDLFTYTYTPDTGFSGEDSMVYSLELIDLNGKSYYSTAMVNFDVKPSFDTCDVQLRDDHFFFQEDNGNGLSLNVLLNDKLCQTVGYELKVFTQPINGEAEIYYPPNSNFPYILYKSYLDATQYEDTLTYTVALEKEILLTAKVVIEVNAEECQLMVRDDYYYVNNDSLTNGSMRMAEFSVLSNDNICEWQGLEYGISGDNNSVGEAAFSGTTLLYTIPVEYSGNDTVRYMVCEGITCKTGKVLIEVE